jgi:bifunctional enzyme CysN/CysC
MDANPAEPAAVPSMGPDQRRGTLRFLTCGSVDDGKSTLIGRLLYDARLVLDDQMDTLLRDSSRYGNAASEMELGLLLDGLEAERQQGITIDVAYRFLATERRSFIVADAPGHEQYTRNMATAASVADLAVILVDARKGLLPQTKRHLHICALLGVRHVVLAINKIDLVGYAQDVFERIAREFSDFAARFDFRSIMPIPVSAREGDNVAAMSANTPWFQRPSLLAHLESVDVESDIAAKPFRFPVQWVNRPDADFRGLAGTVASGRIRRGADILVLPAGTLTRVARIVTADGDREEAVAGDAVTLTLAQEIDVVRGDLLVAREDRAQVGEQFAADLLWMADTPLFPGRTYLMRIGTKWTPASVTAIKHKFDVDTLEHLAARQLLVNEIAFCNLATAAPVAFDPYAENRETGAFILVDRDTNQTLGAGMIRFALRRASNIHWEKLAVDKAARAGLKRQEPRVLWFTGLSGSGKSTIARIVELKLHAQGCHTYMLDGDNVRHGLSRDLGFTDADRVENIRRIGEVAKLMLDAGLIVLCAFISPFHAEREMVRDLLQPGEFIEIFVDAPLEECIRRDPKGLYAKAKAGLITNFTGFDSAYDPPTAPDLHLDTMAASADELAAMVLERLSGA